MNKGRITTEGVEDQEEIVERHRHLVVHLLEISADGVVTEVEKTSYLQLMSQQEVQQNRQLQRWMAIDLICKWVGTMVKRGATPRNLREMRRDFGYDPYGAMASE